MNPRLVHLLFLVYVTAWTALFALIAFRLLEPVPRALTAAG